MRKNENGSLVVLPTFRSCNYNDFKDVVAHSAKATFTGDERPKVWGKLPGKSFVAD
jgi:hypothetical protein